MFFVVLGTLYICVLCTTDRTGKQKKQTYTWPLYQIVDVVL